MTTLKELKDHLRPHGITVTSKNGEHRVSARGGKEASAYYTNDSDDALGTGLAMAAHVKHKASKVHKPEEGYRDIHDKLARK
jgi:hypothetical protein